MRDRRNSAARQPALDTLAGTYTSADAAATTHRTVAPSSVLNIRLAVALIAVGVLLLTVHYFAPVLLLAALPTREWRKAATQ